MIPEDEKILKLEGFYNILMIIGFILFVGAIVIVIFEFHSAKVFCHSQGVKHSFKLVPKPAHFCNSSQIYLYGFKWDYDRNISKLKYYP